MIRSLSAPSRARTFHFADRPFARASAKAVSAGLGERHLRDRTTCFSVSPSLALSVKPDRRIP
jgi:hypothetical protein